MTIASLAADILVGAHVSISGGIDKAVTRGEEIGATAIQIFSKSSRSWFEKKLTEEDIEAFKEALKQSPIRCVVAHTSYLINIGSPKADIEKKSVTSLFHELERCEQLGIPYLIMHPGSHVGDGVERAVTRIAHNLDKVLERGKGITKILLETAAGQGSNVGRTFEEVRSIYDQTKHRKMLGICIDTCHIYSAGYDIGTPQKYHAVMKEFDRVIGLGKLHAIHINNSKTACGSRLDRHEKIKKGTIPLDVFQAIMRDPHLKKVPKILETPLDKDASEFADEIKLLKSYYKK